MNILLDAPPVTKAWISSVLAVAALTYLNYIDVEKYVHFTSFKQLIFAPQKLVLSLCYCGELDLIKIIDIYQMLGFLSGLETLHTRSTMHFMTKILSMIGLVLVFHTILPILIAPKLFGHDIIFSRDNIELLYGKVFHIFSLRDLLMLNFMYYHARFQGEANFNNWFNVHAVVMWFSNCFTISNKLDWKTLLLFVLPGHTLYYLDTIIPRIYRNNYNKTFVAGLIFSVIFWCYIAL